MLNPNAQKRMTKNPYLYQSHQNNYFYNKKNIQPQNKLFNSNNFLMFGENGVKETVVTSLYPKDKDIKYDKSSNANKKINPNYINFNKNIDNNIDDNINNNIDIIQNKESNNFKASVNINQSQNNFNLLNSKNNNQAQISENKELNKINKIYQSQTISKVNPFNQKKSDYNMNNINNINNNVQNLNQNTMPQNSKLLNPKRIIKKNNNQKSSIQKQQSNQSKIINIERQNQIKKNPEQQNYTFSRYTRPSMTGLVNLEHTSYLNSVLQLLCSIRSFASYFLNPKNGDFFTKNIINYPISYVMYRLCTHLYPYPEKSKREIYKPDSLMEVLGSYNIVYGDYAEKNPNDFIVFLINILNHELNSKKSSAIISQNNYKKFQSDKDKLINYGIQDFINNNNSIISNFFTWFNIKSIQCIKCSNNIYSFQHYSTFELNLIDAAKLKKNQGLTLSDCLDFYQLNQIKPNIFCEYCKGYNSATLSNKIYSTPYFFIFLLNENKNNNFVLEENLNLEKYIESKDKSPTNYQLSGIVFFDKSKNKYNSLCISPIDKNWYLYDDENVQPVQIKNFLNICNNKKINYNTYQLCILFYSGISK